MQQSGQPFPGQMATGRTQQIKELQQAFKEEKNNAYKESIHHFQTSPRLAGRYKNTGIGQNSVTGC